MCWHGGTMTLEEYKQEIKDIKELAIKELEDEKDDEIFEVILDMHGIRGLRKMLCKQYLPKLDKMKITGISLI